MTKKSTTFRTNKEQKALNFSQATHKNEWKQIPRIVWRYWSHDVGSLTHCSYHFVEGGIDEAFDLLLQFLCPRRDHGIMSRILVRHRITHDDPTTWPFPYPSEAIAPDSEISIFVIIIVKEADALILLINFATATRPDSMIKALQEASSTMLSISSAAITFHSNCFWELLATRIASILSLISWGTLRHGSKFLFFQQDALTHWWIF